MNRLPPEGAEYLFATANNLLACSLWAEDEDGIQFMRHGRRHRLVWYIFEINDTPRYMWTLYDDEYTDTDDITGTDLWEVDRHWTGEGDTMDAVSKAIEEWSYAAVHWL